MGPAAGQHSRSHPAATAAVALAALDGTLDFVGNAIGHRPADASRCPVDVRQGVDRAGQDEFSRFLALCARAKAGCAFSAGGNLPAKWATLLARARAGQVSYQALMIAAYYDLEKPIADWPNLASYLQHLYRTTAAGRVLPLAEQARMARAAHVATAAYTGNRAHARPGRPLAEFAYLVAGKLPPTGTVCQVDALPSGLP